MEQQEINNDFNPPHLSQSLSQQLNNQIDKHRTYINAQKRLKQLSRHIYPNFPPYHTYFNLKQYHITLHKGQSKDYIHAGLYDRQRLCIERQAMYYRGAVDEYLDDQILKPYIEQSNKEKGYIHKRGKKSLINNGAMIYAHESTIKAIQLPSIQNPNKLQVYQQSLQPLTIIDFGEGNTILQFESLQNHQLNTMYEGMILKVRFARKIVIFSVKQRKTLSTIQSPTEFIGINNSIYAKNMIQILEYDGQQTILSTYQLQNKEDQFKLNLKESFKINGLVNTKININRNQSILTKYEAISMLDKRYGKQTQLYPVKNPTNQKIYSSILLKGHYHYSPLIANCHSRHISIFDIRKPNQLIQTYLHHSQESPPSIMNFYDGTHSSSLYQPIIACHSPYALGSSMFLPLNTQHFQGLNILEKEQLDNFKQPLKDGRFTLLHDQSKSVNQSGLHRYFNESLALWNQSSKQFSVFKVENEGSISMETFNYDQKSEKYQRREFNPQKQDFLKVNRPEQNPSQIWLQQTMIKKYFHEQTTYQQQAQIEINPPIPKNKKKTTKKAQSKKKSKTFDKINELKQPQTEVDLQDFLDGQYQNSSECPESPSKRKVNFADLSQFYSTLQQKATYPKAVSEKKNDHLDFSLSTQANSQGLNFSQSNEIDTGIKALSFHNKKLMNYSILDKLKNDWDN